METKYLYPTELNVFKEKGIIDVRKDGRLLLVDADTNSREILGAKDLKDIYTVTGVSTEASSKWGNVLDAQNILESYSINEIRDNSGTMSITTSIGEGPDFKSTVHFSPLNNTVSCENCGTPVTGFLTSDYGSVYVCRRLSENDQRLLVRDVAVPFILMLITNDGCLGWSSAALNSYCLRKRKYWRSYFQDIYASNNFSRKN